MRRLTKKLFLMLMLVVLASVEVQAQKTMDVAQFYLFLNYAGSYAPYPSLVDNHFYVDVVKNETRFGLSINNRDYISKHGHYLFQCTG